MKPEFVNIAAYKFVSLQNLGERKTGLLSLCKSLDLKGTILLSREGINLFLAGSQDGIESFLAQLRSIQEFADIPVKESLSDHQPFSRMLVRLKKEIISMGVPEIEPLKKTSPKLSARQLKQWLDDGRDLTLLDVRNDYEIQVGTFENAVPIGVDHFRQFPDAAKRLPGDMKRKPVVMFCTGGIRCEKAGPLMEREGFDEVFQLDGGILKYFEEVGGEHYDGECFVFDKRVALDAELKETDTQQCYGCQSVLTLEDQQSERYDPPDTCPYCFRTDDQKQRDLLEERDNQLAKLTTPLPGNEPYDNIRPMNVPLAFESQPAIDFLESMHSHLDRDYWVKECELGRVTYKDRNLSPQEEVRAGWRVEHHIPQTIEPDVSNQVRFLYEDDGIIAVCKPAPLPMHPCGRFNRNTLVNFLAQVYHGERIRIVHRLDANTTGIVLFCRKRSAAAAIQPQFVDGTVEKTYVARVVGHPKWDQLVCDAAISSDAALATGTRRIDDEGLAARTEFKLIEKYPDGTSLLECYPKTGRTNQIRLHLCHIGLPIVGDPSYLAGDDRGKIQTKSSGEQPMCLHAWKISILHPVSGQPLGLTAPLPEWAERPVS